MLLNSKITFISDPSPHSASYIKDIQYLFKSPTPDPLFTFSTQPTTAALQYFNKRVTQRLHRYRSMKKHWQEVATSVQNNASLSPTCESPTSFPDISSAAQEISKSAPVLPTKSMVESKTYCINDYINSTTAAAKDNQERNIIELDPLHTRIQQDLIKLRSLIKAKERKSIDNTPVRSPPGRKPARVAISICVAFDEQENKNLAVLKKASALQKLKPLERVQISGCQMRPSLLPQSDSTDSGLGSNSNSSSTCSQYCKQQKSKRQSNNKTFNICHSRVNPPPLPSESFVFHTSCPLKTKTNATSKMTQNTSSKQTLTSRLATITSQVPSELMKKQASFTKQETLLPPIRQVSDIVEPATGLYRYVASSSSTTPRSMILKRNTSLLPILLQSSSCMGIQLRESRPKKPESDLEEEEKEEQNDNDNYNHLLGYKQLINRLPRPVISTSPKYGHDDFGILFEQLDHIRETMPDSNTYDIYARSV